jgi:hypothetical protein
MSISLSNSSGPSPLSGSSGPITVHTSALGAIVTGAAALVDPNQFLAMLAVGLGLFASFYERIRKSRDQGFETLAIHLRQELETQSRLFDRLSVLCDAQARLLDHLDTTNLPQEGKPASAPIVAPFSVPDASSSSIAPSKS